MIRGMFAVLFTLVGMALASDIVTIEDKSAAASPLRNSGTAIVTEQPHDGQFDRSIQASWVVTNSSTKDIVAVVESLSVEYPSGARGAQVNQYELFFQPSLMKPGDTVPFETSGRNEVGQSPLIVGSSRSTCDVTTLWVQFADGTTFGDAQYAEPLLRGRRASLEAMSRLRDIYQHQGTESFIEELKDPTIPKDADLYAVVVQDLRTLIEQKHNMRAACRRLEQKLDVAQARIGLLN